MILQKYGLQKESAFLCEKNITILDKIVVFLYSRKHFVSSTEVLLKEFVLQMQVESEYPQ